MKVEREKAGFSKPAFLHYASITNRSLRQGLKFTYWSSSLFVSTCAVSFSFNEDAFLTSRMNSCR